MAFCFKAGLDFEEDDIRLYAFHPFKALLKQGRDFFVARTTEDKKAGARRTVEAVTIAVSAFRMIVHRYNQPALILAYRERDASPKRCPGCAPGNSNGRGASAAATNLPIFASTPA